MGFLAVIFMVAIAGGLWAIARALSKIHSEVKLIRQAAEQQSKP